MTLTYQRHRVPCTQANYDRLMEVLFPQSPRHNRWTEQAALGFKEDSLCIELILSITDYPGCCGYRLAYYATGFLGTVRTTFRAGAPFQCLTHKDADSLIKYLSGFFRTVPVMFSDVKDGALYRIMCALAKHNNCYVLRIGSFRNPNSGNRVYTNVAVPMNTKFDGGSAG